MLYTLIKLVLGISVAVAAVPGQTYTIEPKEPPTVEAQEISRSEVIALINKWSDYYGVDRKLTLTIAEIESQLDPKAKNPNSSALGLYQWTSGSWMYYCKNVSLEDRENPNWNAKCAIRVMAEQGIDPWLAEPRNVKLLEEKNLL